MSDKKALKIKASATEKKASKEVEKLTFDELRLVYGGAEGGGGGGGSWA